MVNGIYGMCIWSSLYGLYGMVYGIYGLYVGKEDKPPTIEYAGAVRKFA